MRVVVAGSDWVVRSGLRSVLEERRSAVVVAEANGSAGALAAVRQLGPDALLLTVGRPPSDRLEVIPAASKLTRVLAFADTADPRIAAEVLAAGAVAVLVHGERTAADRLRAVADAGPGREHLSRSVATGLLSIASRPTEARDAPGAPGRSLLSHREREVMDHIARGRSNSEIAHLLWLSEKAIKNHVNRIFAKLAVSSRSQAIVLWLAADGRASRRAAGALVA